MDINTIECGACGGNMLEGKKVWVIMHNMETRIGEQAQIIRWTIKRKLCGKCVDQKKIVSIRNEKIRKITEKGGETTLECDSCGKKIVPTDIYFSLLAIKHNIQGKKSETEGKVFPMIFWCYDCGIEKDGTNDFKKMMSEIMVEPWASTERIVSVKFPEIWKQIRERISQEEILKLTMKGWRRTDKAENGPKEKNAGIHISMN